MKWILVLILFAMLTLLGGCAATTTAPVPTAIPTSVPSPIIPTARPSPTPAPTDTPVPIPAEGPLSGLPAPPGQLRWPPIAVMIPSDSEQYGLSQASVVYEAPVEYQIPRFMAIFEWADASRIGPVRSARPYYVDWACPYGPLFVHWGGSPQALTLLAERDCLRPLDGLTYGAAYFVYDEDEQVPWNSQFISSDSIYGYMQNWEIARTVFYQGYLHKEDALAQSRPLTGTIAIDQSFSYAVRYLYDPGTNSYLREYKGRPHLDMLTGEQHRVKNVVILFVPQEPIPGDLEGRLEIQMVGDGEAWIFRDGAIVRGRWRKEAVEAELLFYDESGQEVSFNRGSIWIEVLAPGEEVVYVTGQVP